MITILLMVIYMAFISLGLPDSLLGSAWPQMQVDLGAGLSTASVLSMIVSGGTILSDPGTFTPPSTTEMTTGETTKSKTPEASETVSPEVASPPVTASIPPPP